MSKPFKRRRQEMIPIMNDDYCLCDYIVNTMGLLGTDLMHKSRQYHEFKVLHYAEVIWFQRPTVS